MYPQTVVPSGDNLHTTLTNGMGVAGSGVTFTGDYYTANKNDIAWSSDTHEKNPVYEYRGNRYVRATPWSYETNATTYRYNYSTAENPDYINQSGYRWFKVEPIKWIILNYNDENITFIESDEKLHEDMVTDFLNLHIVNKSATLELYAADVLMSGIPFGTTNHTSWYGSLMNQYLNTDFYNQAFSQSETEMILTSTIYNNTTDSATRDNAAYNLNSNHFVGTGYNPTSQKIYLLSYYELGNAASPYVTNGIFKAASPITANQRRQIHGTDYARSHYLQLINDEGKIFTTYFGRTAHSNGTSVYIINGAGTMGYSTHAVDPSMGTRPAFPMVCFTLLSDYSCNLSKQKA